MGHENKYVNKKKWNEGKLDIIRTDRKVKIEIEMEEVSKFCDKKSFCLTIKFLPFWSLTI